MSDYTAEIKVTRHYEETTSKGNYQSITTTTPARDVRIGHITLVANSMVDLRARVAAVMEQVTD